MKCLSNLKLLSLLVFAFFTFICINEADAQNTNKGANKKEKIKIDPEFEAFWKEFKDADEKSDLNKLKTMTSKQVILFVCSEIWGLYDENEIDKFIFSSRMGKFKLDKKSLSKRKLSSFISPGNGINSTFSYYKENDNKNIEIKYSDFLKINNYNLDQLCYLVWPKFWGHGMVFTKVNEKIKMIGTLGYCD